MVDGPSSIALNVSCVFQVMSRFMPWTIDYWTMDSSNFPIHFPAFYKLAITLIQQAFPVVNGYLAA